MMTSTQWNPEKRWALASLWLLQLGDFLSTMATRRVAGVVELNPFGAGADGHADIMKTATCKLIGLVICLFAGAPSEQNDSHLDHGRPLRDRCGLQYPAGIPLAEAAKPPPWFGSQNNSAQLPATFTVLKYRGRDLVASPPGTPPPMTVIRLVPADLHLPSSGTVAWAWLSAGCRGRSRHSGRPSRRPQSPARWTPARSIWARSARQPPIAVS